MELTNQQKEDLKLLEETKEASALDQEDLNKKLKEIYEDIIKVLKKYCDLNEEYYSLISLWIIGTYLHDSFPTYPYLFFNAMKGSGKTRLLKLISHLSKNGSILVSMSESVLFRTAENSTICIDELENIGSKEKGALKELLNAGYKKGLKVKRVYKTKENTREKMQIEEFNVYCPIAMANIWGMDNVLSDRCITLILERSTNLQITKRMEIFELDKTITEIKAKLAPNDIYVMTLPQNNIKEIYLSWDEYISDTLTYMVSVSNTSYMSFFNKINESELNGRYLELFFPLFIIAEKCNVLDKTINFANDLIKGRKGDDIVESRDISFLYLISQMEEKYGLNDFIQIGSLTEQFKDMIYPNWMNDKKSEEVEWITPNWVGRALRRLNLVIERGRTAQRREVRINYKKAKEKMRIFEPEKIKEEGIGDV